MAAVESLSMVSKFRGCLVGALLGDCLGAVYEGEEEISKLQVQKYFDKLNGPYFKAPYKPYTDDTAMTRSVAESLIENKGFDAADMAKRFVREYFLEPHRGYGPGVTTVFNKLRGSKFADPFGPAREQFDGLGSYGNGAAMRASPVALYCHLNLKKLIDISRKQSEITHTHRLGYNGAILESIAVAKCLQKDPKNKLDVGGFTEDLINEMKIVESDDDGLSLKDERFYENQLVKVKEFLEKEKPPHDEDVILTLGTNVSAIMSVPTAIYCFLRAQEDIPEIKTDNPYRRTIQYAITLGGDTDTIASMAGAIAGAYYGHEVISESLQKHCEGVDYALELANKLHEASVSCHG